MDVLKLYEVEILRGRQLAVAAADLEDALVDALYAGRMKEVTSIQQETKAAYAALRAQYELVGELIVGRAPRPHP